MESLSQHIITFLSGCIFGAIWFYVFFAYMFDTNRKELKKTREALKRTRDYLAIREIRLEHERNVRKGCVMLPREQYRALLRSGKMD